MKKSYLCLVAGVLISSAITAQQHLRCGYTEAMNAVYAQHPEIKTAHQESDAELDELDKEAAKQGYKNGYNVGNTTNLKSIAQKTSGVNGTVYLIPIVFHILHENGSEKIDESQVIDQVRILNRDYRKLNADTTNALAVFKPLIGDVEIEFRLATIDPNGNCTNGIIYHQTTNTDWIEGNSAYYAYTGTTAGKWDPRKYLNVYVVKSITSSTGTSGIAGYTYKPGTWSSGAAQDAIAILHSYVGSIGTGAAFSSRALTHEIGHWFNLSHPWGDTNQPGVSCSGTDNVTDTPTTKGFTSCPASSNTAAYQVCNAGVSENYQNYMDYSYCSIMFTKGQVTRMRSAATSSTSGRSTLSGSSNLVATGVTNPQVCVPVAEFNSNKTHVCSGQTVQFTDNSMNAHPTAWSWSFAGGTPATSTDSIPVITYNTPGTYAVTYTATTSAGSNNISKTAYITVLSGTAAYQTQFIEGFEAAAIPNTDWAITNAGGVTWATVSSAAATGTKSVKVDNTQNTAGSVDEMVGPSINIQNINTTTGSISFTFKVAHQQSASTQKDKLQVFSSSNCGQTWTARYSKSGSALATAGSVSASAFTPTSTQWRTETVNCAALLGSNNVMFKFVFTCDTLGAGNNIYVDDINISGSIGIEDHQIENLLNLQAYPNPSKGLVNISFELAEKHQVSLSVYDILGKSVKNMVNTQLAAGTHKYILGNDVQLSPGVYFMNLNVDGRLFTQKIIVE